MAVQKWTFWAGSEEPRARSRGKSLPPIIAFSQRRHRRRAMYVESGCQGAADDCSQIGIVCPLIFSAARDDARLGLAADEADRRRLRSIPAGEQSRYPLQFLVVFIAEADVAGAWIVVVNAELFEHFHGVLDLVPAIAESLGPFFVGVGHHLFVVEVRWREVEINFAEVKQVGWLND